MRIRKAASADLATNSFATRCRLRSTLRPSRIIAGIGGEAALDQHEVGDRARHLGAAALGDRQARRLQRRDVVDAVADHADVAPLGLERLHEAPLAVGRDPPHDRGLARQLAHARRVGRELAPVDRLPAHRDAGVGGDRGDGRGRVAGDHLDLDALLEQERDGLAGVRAAAPRRGPPAPSAAAPRAAAASGPGGRSATSPTAKASTRRPASASRRARSCRARAQGEVLRRAQHVGRGRPSTGRSSGAATRTARPRARARPCPGRPPRSPRAWSCGSASWRRSGRAGPTARPRRPRRRGPARRRAGGPR